MCAARNVGSSGKSSRNAFTTRCRASALRPAPRGDSLTGDAMRSRTVDLEPGDLLLLYTDGVSETRDAEDRFYPLAARLGSFGGKEPGAVLDELLTDVVAYSADGMTDDAALLAVRCEA